jgi:hypothetical protein
MRDLWTQRSFAIAVLYPTTCAQISGEQIMHFCHHRTLCKLVTSMSRRFVFSSSNIVPITNNITSICIGSLFAGNNFASAIRVLWISILLRIVTYLLIFIDCFVCSVIIILGNCIYCSKGEIEIGITTVPAYSSSPSQTEYRTPIIISRRNILDEICHDSSSRRNMSRRLWIRCDCLLENMKKKFRNTNGSCIMRAW